MTPLAGDTAVRLVEIPTAAGPVEAFVARPEDDGDAADGAGGSSRRVLRPGVLFLMDAIGLRPQLARMAQRVADHGFVVLVPHVLHREGPAADLAPRDDLREPAARQAFFAEAMPRVGRLTADLAEADLLDYLAALRGLDGVGPGEVGVTGYCMGVRLALRAAGLDPQVVAVGGFHGGGLVTDEPDSPHLALASARAEVVLGHADQDASMPPEAVARLGEALDAAGLRGSNEVYAGAAHGYTMADTSMYDHDAAERHFTELLALLDRRLG
ncbi:carboxymethylenebutenolidase [Nocardioides scoriae]|uniref:Carboxymethylenebutenolidase n=1 Tax=Nocardioides scoriae TaxID=642780 RepID=A0A1H1QZY6_9ACTN|nr:dienelactone hydrolase family protein [Nocardioides scoriae]SDS28982.1 carboxymethylenebutenolidase [Nocardioides scoriae]